ncbi:hypothetical protein ABPG72_017106 [Tetrahymena utriculariae]
MSDTSKSRSKNTSYHKENTVSLQQQSTLQNEANKEQNKPYKQIINERIQNRLNEARSAIQSKDYYAAINGFTKVIFLKSNQSETYKELADAYSQINDISTAIMLYKKANQLSYSLVTEDKMKDLLFRKGLMLLMQGEYSDILEGSQYEQFARYLRYDVQSIMQKIYNFKIPPQQIQLNNNSSDAPALQEVAEGSQEQQVLAGLNESNSENKAEQNDEKRKRAFQHFLRAYCYVLTYHKSYALEELDLAIQNDNKYIHAFLLKGKLLWSLNKYAEGNEIFWKAENMFNEHPEVRDFLKIIVPKADELLKETRYLLVQNQLDRCLVNVKKGLELFPNNTQFLLIKAFILRKQGQYENSLNFLLLAFHTLRDKSLEFEVKNQIALTYNEMGTVCFNRNKYEEAIALFNESLQFKPNDWGVITNRGDCYRMQNRIDDALKDYLKAHKIIGDKSELNLRISMMRNSRGIVLFNQKRYDKALKEFNEAIKQSDQVAQYYQNRAKCYVEMKQMQEAIEDYLLCYKLDSTNSEVGVIVNKLKQESVLKKKDKYMKINHANN